MEEILPEHPRFRRLLDAALPCYTLEHEDPRGFMHVYLEVRSGSAHEREDQRGIAHLVEHAVFLGTKELLDAEAVRAALAKIGASMGADSNAFTDYLQTVYTLRCACSGSNSEDERTGEEDHSEEQRRQGMLDASQVGRIGGMLSTRERSRSWGAGDMVVRRDPKDALRDSLELLHQFAFHATMPEAALEIEKSTVLSEMQMRNTCDYRAEEKLTSQVHPTCYLSQRFPIGLKEQIESWSREDILQFYNEHYRADNMRLFVVGPIGPGDVEQTVNAVFQGIPIDRRRSDPSRIKPLPCMCGPPDEPISLHLDPLHTQVSVTVCSMIPLQPLRKLQDVRIMAMDSILQMGLDLRFEALIENDEAHTIVGAGLDHVDSFREGCGILTFSATLSKEKWPQALQSVFQQIANMHAYGLGKSEFEFCVEAIIREAEIDAEQNESQDGAHLIEDLLDSVCLDEAFMDDDQLCQLYKKVLPSITLEEINSHCQHLLSFVMHLSGLMEKGLGWDRHDLAKPGSIFVCAPSSFPEGVEMPEREAIFSMICAALKDPVRPLDLEMPDFLVPLKEVEGTTLLSRSSYAPLSAKKDEVALDKIGIQHELNPKKKCKLDLGYKTRPRVWDPHTRVTRMCLSNGLNLIYRQTDFDRSQVSVTVMAWGGRALEETSAPGSVSIGFQTLMAGGAGGFSADMIGRYAQRHGCEISGLPEAEKVWIRADTSVSSGGLQRAFELLHLFVVRGSFDQKAFLRAKENYRRAYEAMQKDLGGMAASTINELISPDARFLQPSLHSIKQLSLKECRNAIKKQFHPSNMELVVVGDFDPDLLESLVLAYFGTTHENPELTSLPPTIDGNHWQNICFKDCPACRAVVVPEEAKRCILYMAIPTCNRWGMWHSSFRSSLKGSVLGDENSTDRMQRRWLLSVLFELINLKLFSVVREEMGLAYDISFTSKAYAVYFTHGLLMIQATPHPEKAEEVISAVHRCLEGILSDGITDKDVEEAVRPMVSYVSTSLRTNEFWLKSMQGLSLSFWPSSRELVCGALEFLPTINKSQLKELVQEVFPTKLISWECFAMGNLVEGVSP